MERKALNLVFEIRKHEDRTGHSLLAFCQLPRGAEITQLSKEFNKQRAKTDFFFYNLFLFPT